MCVVQKHLSFTSATAEGSTRTVSSTKGPTERGNSRLKTQDSRLKTQGEGRGRKRTLSPRRTSPHGKAKEKAPRRARKSRRGSRREHTQRRRPQASRSYATRAATGRGSAARSSDARPRWVMMDSSRVARAKAAERSGSSAGACCRKNGRTSAHRSDLKFCMFFAFFSRKFPDFL